MTNPLYDPYAVLHSVYGGGAYLKQALSDTPIEELNRARTAKICYGVMENDLFLDFCIRSFAPKNPKLPVRILLKIALYMLVFLKKPRYMVTDNAVSLLKKLGKGGAAGFVNAFLRAFDEQKLVFPKEETAALSVRFSFPEFAVRRIVAAYGKEPDGGYFLSLLPKGRGVRPGRIHLSVDRLGRDLRGRLALRKTARRLRGAGRKERAPLRKVRLGHRVRASCAPRKTHRAVCVAHAQGQRPRVLPRRLRLRSRI